jgi:hypothetical protein
MQHRLSAMTLAALSLAACGAGPAPAPTAAAHRGSDEANRCPATPEPPMPPMCTANMPAGTICVPWRAEPTETPVPACDPETFQRVCVIPGDGAASGKDETR